MSKSSIEAKRWYRDMFNIVFTLKDYRQWKRIMQKEERISKRHSNINNSKLNGMAQCDDRNVWLPF